jgi:hypothetical protein
MESIERISTPSWVVMESGRPRMKMRHDIPSGSFRARYQEDRSWRRSFTAGERGRRQEVQLVVPLARIALGSV